MKDYKAVFCDMDGTLLNDDKKLTPEVIEAVRKLDDKGIPFILVSGRLPVGIYPSQEKLGIKGPVISFGGGLVIDENGKTLLKKGLDRKTALDIERYAKEIGTGAALNFYKDMEWYTSDADHPMEIWEANSVGSTPMETSVEEVTEDGDVINKCMFAGDPADIAELEPLMRERFPELRIVKSLPNLLEVMVAGTKKSEGIELLCERMGLDPSEIVAMGDNYNDLDMLEMAGLPVLMENAPEDLKESLDAYIAPDNNSSGVAKAIEDLFFGE